MNSNQIRIIFLSLILFLFTSLTLFMIGCGKNGKVQKTAGENKKDSTIKQAVYTCPMHSEVRSLNKDDKCPKCGMDLVEMEESTINEPQVKVNQDKYSFSLTTEPKNIKTGEEVTLNFSLMNNETGKPVIDLDIVHEKIFHLIIVSKNLVYFSHIHPEMNSDGSLSVKTMFEKGGDYVLFADLKPKDEKENRVFNLPLRVTGETVQPLPMTPRNTFETEGYTASMTTEPAELSANKPTEIIVDLKKNGKGVTDLNNYLGALGHMVIISEDASMYLHVHPMESEDRSGSGKNEEMKDMKMDSGKITKSGPRVVFHTSFPRTGIYKVFGEFNPGGKLITTNFVVNVK